MTFEDAIKKMREGKFVIFDGRSFPLGIFDGRLCELCPHGIEPLDSMNTCNIMRSDWEEWRGKIELKKDWNRCGMPVFDIELGERVK